MQLTRSDPSRQIWLTESEPDFRGRPIQWGRTLDAVGSGPAERLSSEPTDVGAVVVDPDRLCQSIAGFGAALTDSSVAVLSGMRTDQRSRLLTELFDAERVGLGAIRITLGPSDYSPSFYPRISAQARDAYRQRVELLHQIRQIRPDLVLYASSWSPPEGLKTNGSLLGGSFRSECAEVFAGQLMAEIAGYAADGLDLDYVSVQNEPGHASGQYPSCWMTTADQAAVGRHLRRQLDLAGAPTVLLAHDHNWDLAERAERVLDQADGAFGGIAWHGYSDPAGVGEQSRLSARQGHSLRESAAAGDRELETHFTEVCELDSSTSAASFAWHQRHLMTGVMRHDSRSVLFWNLALDEHGGPAACRQPHVLPLVTVDSATGEVTRHAAMYALAHTSRQVKLGDHRVHSALVAPGPEEAEATRLGDPAPLGRDDAAAPPRASDAAGLSQVAYLRADGDRVVVIGNRSNQPIRTALVEGDRWLPIELAAGAAVTMRYR